MESVGIESVTVSVILLTADREIDVGLTAEPPLKKRVNASAGLMLDQSGSLYVRTTVLVDPLVIVEMDGAN